MDFSNQRDDVNKIEAHLLANGCATEIKSPHQMRMRFNGIQVDILEADPITTESIFKRSIRRVIVTAECNVATPEDLIILKTIADRPIDRRDIAELREIFASRLDELYISDTLKKPRS